MSRSVRRELFVGDVHATPEELDDCRALFRLVRDVAKAEGATRTVLLGDSYHTHAVIRAEVMEFWCETLQKGDFVLVGNHDFAGEGSKTHALMAHRHVVNVVDAPQEHGGVVYMPYYADREQFVVDANRMGGSTLACHQTFQGSTYENGFFAEDGIDPQSLPQKLVISGHIHTPQRFSNVEYIGGPRWRTLSDANIERAIWLFEFDSHGNVVDRKSFDTGTACRKIAFVTDTPESPVELPLSRNVDWRIDVRGPAAWVDERKKLLAGPGVRLRTFVQTAAAPTVRESEGISVAFRKYAEKFSPRFNTHPSMLLRMAEERLRV